MSAAETYATASARIWRPGPLHGVEGAALAHELVRCATLAPSSHNTQPWKFALAPNAITVFPDFARRCPVVDPDDHHLFVSLGCAVENLVLAAAAHGLHAETSFDAARDALRIALTPMRAVATPLFRAIHDRQCTRREYDGTPLAADALSELQRAVASDRVRVHFLTERSAVDTVIDYVVQGNSAQLGDRAFVDELLASIRFNGYEAVRTGDGLYSAASGNPSLPGWLGRRIIRFALNAKTENAKYVRQLRSSAGVAVFVAQAADKAHWIEVGRTYERFALQATALGIRNAFVNQPVEVTPVRAQFARALGLGDLRPDLVVRFGYGATLPKSLRRPVQAVLV